MGIHPKAEQGFEAGTESYERARPGYPEDAVAWMCERIGLAPGRTVVDLGAGTGKLTRMLVARGLSAIAVEPVDSMRARLAALLPQVPSVAGRAESMPLADACADAVTVAQAFHWFDPEPALAEIARVVRPGGGLGLIWNIWDASQPLQHALNRIVQRYRGDAPGHCYRERSDDAAWRARWSELLSASPSFSEPVYRAFAYRHSFERERLRELVASISYIAALGRERRRQVLAEIDALAAGLPARVELHYVTDVFASRRT